ncbi:hypothetical protein PG985_004101 [Apiospora marii]|uniref:uncharacterized protein n=1 Tax=Apiospora marii TaxID=335849 RepID=UPI00312F1870
MIRAGSRPEMTHFASHAAAHETALRPLPLPAAACFGGISRVAPRYEPTLRQNSTPNDTGNHLPNSELRTCKDAILTTFAQLVACRVNATRVFISLFDQHRQYIIAEATATLPLSPGLGHDQRGEDELLLCGTSIPKTEGICCRVLDAEDTENAHGNIALPVIVIPDIQSDSGLASKPYCVSGKLGRAYAGVPIRTQNGINIGVLSLFKESAVFEDGWDVVHSQILRDMSRCIVEHLRSKRARLASQRAQRMARAIGSFVENRSTLPYWEFGGTAEYPEEQPVGEGALNAKQQAKERDVATPLDDDQLFHDGMFSGKFSHEPSQLTNNPASSLDDTRSRWDDSLNSAGSVQASGTQTPKSDTSASPEELNTVGGIFSRAANIMREAIETEGVVFLDAVPKAFGSLTKEPESQEKMSPPSTAPLETSSSDEPRSDNAASGDTSSYADILSFSTSDFSSINRDKPSPPRHFMSAKLLRAIVQKYPTGAILNFDEDGAIQTADPSTDDQNSTSTEQQQDQEPATTPRRSRGQSRARKGSQWKETPEEGLPKVFMGARSVAFVPVWDQKKERCIAGGFAYTCTPARVLTRTGELSYFRAFAMVIMAEIHRLETTLSNKSQSDVLSSLSHELRSPLHGMVLGVELLADTSLDSFQGNVLHTMETCGRTLADTIDHLLYFSKINNYVGPDKRPDQGARGLRLGTWPNLEAGMKSIYMNVQLDSLVEEVVESVFAGFNFFMISAGQIQHDSRPTGQDVAAVRRHDRRQAIEEIEHAKRGTEGFPDSLPGGYAVPLLIDLDIDPAVSHYFRTIPGGVRRIIMNLLGNSLKYTSSGSIRITLSQEWGRTKRMRTSGQLVRLAVADTGRGISPEFLRENLYQPFAQEDRLAPGLGLGLNVVKKVANSLGGRVTVESEVGLGTTVTVRMPLQPVTPADTTSVTKEEEAELAFFGNQRQELKGLRICLVGFDTPIRLPLRHKGSAEAKTSPQSVFKICQNWLLMEVVSTTEATEFAPDLILCEDSATSCAYMSSPESLKAPIVVMCADVPTAFQRSTAVDAKSSSRVMDFVSQPLGPRKLAKVLLAAVKRWVEHQDTVPPPPRPLSSLTLDVPPSRHNLGPRRAASWTSNKSGASSRGTRKSQGISEDGQPSARGDRSRPESPRPEEQSQEQSQVQPQDAQPSNSPGSEKGEPLPKFLLVDDNPINLKILSAYMKKLSLSFATAKDGQEAVDKVCQLPGQYACIFMDINMPRLDGLQATRQIRNFEKTHGHAPSTIIALSGLASASVQQEAFQSGIELFLTKPVQLKEISEILTARGLL